MSNSKWVKSIGIFAGVAVTCAPALAQATVMRDCYKIADDADRDGYARAGAKSSQQPAPSNNELGCPSGYVRGGDDCNDNDAQVYPRRTEIRGNSVDDNCSVNEQGPSDQDPKPLPHEAADEPQILTSSAITSSSFTPQILINNGVDEDLSAGASGILLIAEVQYYPMIDTAAVKRAQSFVTVDRTTHQATLTAITGLKPMTVYAARLRFLVTNWVTTSVWRVSEVFYFVTKPSGTSRVDAARLRMLNDGFAQYRASQRGEVGYRGTKARDGTRYTAAAGEQWCSEFYMWLTSPYLRDIDGANTVEDIVDFFQDYGEWHTGQTLAFAGEYLGLDTNDDGKKNHSAMVLGYDRAKSVYRTLEGNFANTVGIGSRGGAEVLGAGYIVSSMVE